MLPKICKIVLILVALSGVFCSSLDAQDIPLQSTCAHLAFEDRIHLSVRPFAVSAPSVDKGWGAQLAVLLRHALLETNCFHVHRKEATPTNTGNHFFVDGDLLIFSNSFSPNRAALQMMLKFRNAPNGEVLWQQLIEVNETETRSTNSNAIFGVDLSTQPIDPLQITALRNGIQKAVQVIQEKQKPLSPVLPNFSNGQFLHLMVLPDLPSYKEILAQINQPNTKAVLQSVSKALEEKGYLIKDLRESLKISEEKYQTRKDRLRDPFDILLENAPADILVYVDLRVDTRGLEKQVHLLLTAKDRYTAQLYAATPLLSSTKRQWPGLYQPALEALTSAHGLDEFVEDLDQQMAFLLKNGRKIDLTLESADVEQWPLNAFLFSDSTLANLIIDWARKKSPKKQVQTQGISAKMLRLEGSFPIRNKEGLHYSPLDYGLELQTYLKNHLTTCGLSFEAIEIKIIGSRVHLSIR